MAGALRRKLDAGARAALRQLPWPLRRAESLSTLCALGEDVVDQLLAAAAPPPPGPVTPAQRQQQQQQRVPGTAAATAAAAADAHEEGVVGGTAAGAAAATVAALPPPDLHVGRRYWAAEALAALRKQQAVEVMQQVAAAAAAEDQLPAAGGGGGGGSVLDVAALERGALAIAGAHYPTADLTRVAAELAALGAELARRMAEQGAAPGSVQALHILNKLLFGPPELPPPHPLGLPPTPAAHIAAAAAAPGAHNNLAAAPAGPSTATATATALQQHVRGSGVTGGSSTGGAAGGCPPLVAVAGRAGGVGLRGCSEGDYYNPANSLLPDVLSYRRRCGIPIALAAVNLAVAARGGLGGRLQLIGLPARVVNRFIPTDGDGGSSSGGGGCSSGDCSSGASARELFVDVFSGRVLEWEELRRTLAGMGVALGRHHVRPLSAAAALERMAANLHGIYRDAGDLRCLRLALDLAVPVAEQPRDLLARRYRVSMALEDWADAAFCLDAMRVAAGLGGGGAAGVGAGGGGGGGAGGGGWDGGWDGAMRRQLAAQMDQMQGDLRERRQQWAASAQQPKRRRQQQQQQQQQQEQGQVQGQEQGQVQGQEQGQEQEQEQGQQQGQGQQEQVLFPVGTMMQHRVYGYRGVIVDWDPRCDMDEEWIRHMGVDRLPGGGRAQPFYRVLVSASASPSAPAAVGAGAGAGAGADDGGRQEQKADEQAEQAEQQGPTEGQAAGQAAAGRPEMSAAAAGGGGGGCRGQAWAPFGPASELTGGVHQRLQAQETYVAQVNIQVLVPRQPAAATATAAAAAAAAATAATGDAWQPPEGVTTVSVPADFQVVHPELGRYMAGKSPGQLRYVPLPATAARFPEDDCCCTAEREEREEERDHERAGGPGG
ncbi:hypothetical protein HYH02_010831 [Chlamydomonas schloesseri]|uniref:Hemimethylated DNA-binding domain-containing protein n=1 Tax=Chlamydomonas schloesseri TaxID=2026947 RepID=A0A835T6K5_9CHLO|nr:hypothetical protein HYH02_010831 [Chlamydomonas schloesseri]|eukprot:KAG2438376.1 hypothetical protein HYH02_010831 [Chlamydomonas schloesseri]